MTKSKNGYVVKKLARWECGEYWKDDKKKGHGFHRKNYHLQVEMELKKEGKINFNYDEAERSGAFLLRFRNFV